MENNLAKEIIGIGQNIKRDIGGEYESLSRLYDIVNSVYSKYVENKSDKSRNNYITGNGNYLID